MSEIKIIRQDTGVEFPDTYVMVLGDEVYDIDEEQANAIEAQQQEIERLSNEVTERNKLIAKIGMDVTFKENQRLKELVDNLENDLIQRDKENERLKEKLSYSEVYVEYLEDQNIELEAKLKDKP